jgi:hypothetical protein
MKLYHTATRRNLASIETAGLCVRYADPQARIKGCWWHTASKSAWALLHGQHKHGASLAEVVIVEVNVPRRALTRFRTGRCVHHCRQQHGAARRSARSGRVWRGGVRVDVARFVA